MTSADSGRRVLLTAASRIHLSAPRWAWDTASAGAPPSETEGRIPAGSLTIGAGRAGIGKSQHAVWLAANITRGTLSGCYFGTPHSVIYAASEDSWEMTIGPRLVAAGADLDRVLRIEVSDDTDPHARLTLPTDTALLEDAVRAHDVVMIVMDPLLSLIDAAVNDYRAREVRDALEPLIEIAHRTGCALYGLAHFTKAIGSDPLLLIAGSGAFGQLVRAGIGYARDEATDSDTPRCVMSTIKSNLGREDLPSLAYRIEPASVDTADGPAWVSRLEFDGTADRSVREVLRDSMTPDDEGSRDEAAEWLIAYLTERGAQAPAGEVIKAAARDGIARATLDRARRRAGITTAKGGMGTGWTWCLPAGRTHEEPEELTHTKVRPSGPSAGSSAPSKLLLAGVTTATEAPTRPCGHPGDPATRCGACIAEKLNREACEVCGSTDRSLDHAGICDRDDHDHEIGRRSLGIAS